MSNNHETPKKEMEEYLSSMLCTPWFSKKNERISWLRTIKFAILKEIKKVIFHEPATIILWTDGTKTVVKCKDGDKYDKQTGFLMCYLKGIVGNKTLLKEIDKWVDDNGKG